MKTTDYADATDLPVGRRSCGDVISSTSYAAWEVSARQEPRPLTAPSPIRAIRVIRGQFLLALLLGALLLAGGAGAATLTVTNLADHGPGTLRQRIADASLGDKIDFAVTGTINLTNGELTIATNLSICGPGESNLIVDAGFKSRVLRVAGGDVQLSGMTLAHGFAGSDGGGILNAGSLELRRCRFMTNLAFGGGGGILNTKKLVLIDSSFEGNIALAGGALFHSGMDTVTVNPTWRTGGLGIREGLDFTRLGQKVCTTDSVIS